MKDYANLTKEEFLALTPEQLKRMSLDELRTVALNLVKWFPIEEISKALSDMHIV